MAIAAPNPPFDVSDRVTSDAANTYGAPVNAAGTVVHIRNSVTSTGLAWIATVRFPVTGLGPSAGASFDFDYLATDLALTNP
jgi:hypothetical protein